MPGIDPTIALGVKVPDQMTQLSSLLGAANQAQTYQSNNITLQERQRASQYLSNPSNYMDKDGNMDFRAAVNGVMSVAPTTGMQYVHAIMDAQKQHTEATSALNSLADQDRLRFANTLATIPPDASPEVVNGTVDALAKPYKGRLDGLAGTIKEGYKQALQGGPAQVAQYMDTVKRGMLPQTTQQDMDTPTTAAIDNGQQAGLLNLKPGVRGVAQGQIVPGSQVQKQLPPNTPTVGPNNQPGYVGPQPTAPAQPAPQPGMNGNFQGDPAQVMADIQGIKDPQERANATAAFNEQAKRTPGFSGGGGFVPSGAVPGANESKAATIAVNNDHWAKLNAQAENSQTLESVIQNIKALAPKAITGTLAGRTSFVNGMLNSMHLGDKITGDLQKDTDLLEKNMAQLNLGTPAATDAVRTIVGAARPHGTMQTGAIEEASDQLLGQIRANRAVRNALTLPKQIQDQKGDASVYTQTRQHMEELADPRIFQYESLPAGKARAAFLAKQPDAAALVKKAQALVQMGVVQ